MKNNALAVGLIVFLTSIEPAHCRDLTASAYLKNKVSNLSENNSDNIIDSVLDYEILSKKTLEEAWDSLPPSKRSEFKDVFRRLIRKNLSKHVKDLKSGVVSWTGEEPCHTHVIVHASYSDAIGESQIDFILRSTATGLYRIDDVVISGSSTVNNYRSIFRRAIAKGGIDNLIQKMRARLAVQ